MDQTSYLEQCIQALPLEKQAAARKAFEDFWEGDDSTFSRLLVVLEATNSFAKGIPKELAEIANRLLAELDQRKESGAHDDAERQKKMEERFRALLVQQVPVLGRALAVDKLATQLEQQKAATIRLGRSIDRLRHLRVGGVLALMALSVLLVGGLGAAAYWNELRTWRSNACFLQRLGRAGIELKLLAQQDGRTVLRVEGPVYRGTAWRLDEHEKIKGVDLAIRESR